MTKELPLILAIDTTGAFVSVALMTPDEVIGVLHEDMERGQGERLIPAVDELMRASGRSMQELTGVAVAVGPGSFTGVRIALAAARGFGLALNIPVGGVTSFEAAAWGIGQPVQVILDTKRGDFYVQGFDATGMPTSAPQIRTPESLQSLKDCRAAVGDGAVAAAKVACFEVIIPSEPSAVRVGRVALSRLSHPLPPEPLYLREADVTLPRR